MTDGTRDTKSIVCVRLPDGGLRFYVNGLMLPVLRSTEDYGHHGHVISLTLDAGCIDFQPRPYYSAPPVTPAQADVTKPVA